MKLIIRYKTIKYIGEDFVLTPYVSLVFLKKNRLYGLGLHWGFYAIAVFIGFNIPKNLPLFKQA